MVWGCRPDCRKAFFDADTLAESGDKRRGNAMPVRAENMTGEKGSETLNVFDFRSGIDYTLGRSYLFTDTSHLKKWQECPK